MKTVANLEKSCESNLTPSEQNIEHSRFTSGIYVPAAVNASVYDFLSDKRVFSGTRDGILIPVVSFSGTTLKSNK
jgi:hypothetical protein